jgi:hypothetical protein
MGYKGNQAGVAAPPVPSSASAYGSYTGNGFHNGTHQDPSFGSHPSSNSQFGDGYYAQFGAPVIGEPANPSVHPDNQQAATLTYTGSSQASFMKKAPAQPTTGYYYGQQQQQQPSTSYSSAAPQQPPNTSSSPYVQTSALPGGPGTGEEVVFFRVCFVWTMEIIVQAKACTQRGSKPIFRAWSTSGLISGSILWQLDFYTKPFLGFGIRKDCLQDRFSGILILIIIIII